MDKIKITCTKEQREALDKMLRLGFCTSTTYSSIFQAKIRPTMIFCRKSSMK